LVAEFNNPESYDIVFCDTCIGGSTVAASFARPDHGLRAFFLADYEVNPLGTRSEAGVREALDRWVDIAADRAPVMVIACNTASVRLEDSPGVRRRAEELGLDLYSMVDLLDSLLRGKTTPIPGARVCLIGTEYTVGRPVYREHLRNAGAREVIALGATRTERVIAHLRHTSPEGRRIIRDEIGDTLADADAVLLACTCFPLVSDLIDQIRPGILQLDPGPEVCAVAPANGRDGPNCLTLAYTGSAVTHDELEAQAPVLFTGWDRIDVVRLAD
jgi:glutamate racemase